VSVYGPLLLHFRPPQLLIFNFDADPDPVFDFFVDLDLYLAFHSDAFPKIDTRVGGCWGLRPGLLRPVFRIRDIPRYWYL
jgi:hypothetical protein